MDIGILLLQLSILMFSIVVHEVSHGLIAYKNGDDTAYLLGRLSFNPIKHIDPVGSVLVPFLCYISGAPIFGWAKPVPVNTVRLNSPRRDIGLVSVAGPASNIILAILFLIILKVLTLLNPAMVSSSSTGFYIMRYAVMINILLAFFNMLPIPPLDGSKVLASVLPYDMADKYMSLNRYGMLILLGFILFRGVDIVLIPVMTFFDRLIIRIILL
ncbi:Zn-dependent protease (includes SpoIVFB) [Parelusimicrobium proximum]|uniref:site-2 protease family protein n=1 Tax=Parelusimicrobium proximum TaxID=3228953 RepID=UPI003D181B07